MTDKEREKSYEHYKQWQENKGRYKNECIAYVLMIGIGFYFILEHWKGILLGIGIVLIVGAIYFLYRIVKKWYKMRKGMLMLEIMAKEAGAENIEIDYAKGTMSFNMSSENKSQSLNEFQSMLNKNGLKMKISQEKKDFETQNKNDKKMKSTDVGYINRNQQKNLGNTNQEGTDNNQYFYDMECLKCGHKYYANGTDIWQRKCPVCQGGKQ